MQSDQKLRPWQEITFDLINEKDQDNVLRLSKELTAALDAQGLGHLLESHDVPSETPKPLKKR